MREEATELAEEIGKQDATTTINMLEQERIEELEADLHRYRKLADLHSRSQFCEQWMLIGEKLAYRPLILFHVRAGPDGWQAFMDMADEEYLAQAIAAATHFYDDLKTVYCQS